MKPKFECKREVIVEGIGTFVLVFAGTGAVMANELSGKAVTHIGISFVFGAVVAALIYSLGHLSGAHFNPAVTLAFWASGFFPQQRVLPYIAAQSIGAVIASALCGVNLPEAWVLREVFQDWQLEDPEGQGIETFRQVRSQVKQRVEQLIQSLITEKANVANI